MGDGTTDSSSTFTTLELIPDTTYHYRFVASNTAGTTYGSDVVFTTLVSPVNSPSMWFQPVDINSGVAASQLDTTQPFDARAADDFLYPSPAAGAIGQVRWWLAEWNGAPPYVTPSAFNIYIYTNNTSGSGDFPADVIQSWTIPVSECHEELFDSATGTYSFWTELDPKFVPEADVHYWLSIQPVLDYLPQAGLKLASGPANLFGAMQIFALAGLPNWTTLTSGSDIAYILYPAIDGPIPSVLGTNGEVVISGELASITKGTDFGTISLGDSVTNVYSITNSGTETLSITSATINGAGAASFSVPDMPASVEAGAASNFSVIFNPASAGIYSASLSIVNNSTSSPYVINLEGMVDVFPWPMFMPAVLGVR